ncbi:MAG: hypothetical protein AABX51_00950 [Nanoarchaeota archaeon]|mgnify:CR=1 FL=1
MRFQSSIALFILLLFFVGCKQTISQNLTIDTQLNKVTDDQVLPKIPQQNNSPTEAKAPIINNTAQNQPAAATAPPQVLLTSCTDSDGGIEENSKGTAMISFSDGTTKSFADSCVSLLVLSEQSCQASNVFSKQIFCINGCDAGTCQSGVASLSQYPSFFQGDSSFKIVLGDTAPVSHVQAAIEVATSLTAAFSVQVESKLSSEVSDPFAQSLLVIGNACDNPATAKLLGNPSPCSDDIKGEGKIRIAQAGGKTYVIVTGGDQTDIRKASRVLAKYADYSLTGSTIRVGGTLANPEILS